MRDHAHHSVGWDSHAIVRSPLDIRWSLEKNIDQVIPLELVDDTSLAKRKHVRVKLSVLGLLTTVSASLE
jgi:hypothetical protein